MKWIVLMERIGRMNRIVTKAMSMGMPAKFDRGERGLYWPLMPQTRLQKRHWKLKRPGGHENLVP